MSQIIHYKGNLSPSLGDTVKVNGVAFDLTGCSVKFKMRLDSGSSLKVDAAGQVVSAPAGTVRYDWAAPDVDAPGFYVGWWEVTFASGKKQDSDEFPIELREHAPSAGQLITLEQARRYLQKEGGKRGQDQEISDAITEASRQIMQFCEREFTPPVAAATRRFRLELEDPLSVDLCPFDLRSVTSVTLHPEASTPKVLAASEYQLEPLDGYYPYGVYNRILLSRLTVVVSQHTINFGHALVDVGGAWGFLTVPEDVQHWCKVTVWSWIRGEVQAFTSSYSVDTGRFTFPEELPKAVQNGLRMRWKRYGPIA